MYLFILIFEDVNNFMSRQFVKVPNQIINFGIILYRKI